MEVLIGEKDFNMLLMIWTILGLNWVRVEINLELDFSIIKLYMDNLLVFTLIFQLFLILFKCLLFLLYNCLHQHRIIKLYITTKVELILWQLLSTIFLLLFLSIPFCCLLSVILVLNYRVYKQLLLFKFLHFL